MVSNETPDWVLKRRQGKWRGRKERYPLSTMQVGELFTIPVVEQTCSYRSLRVLVSARGKKLGRLFMVGKREDGTFEIWRES